MIEHPPSVTLVVTDGDELVLVRQPRPGAGGTVLELPAGKVEPGETLYEAADRELAEECGLAVGEWTELGSFWLAPAYSTELVHVLAGTCSGTASAEHDADEEIEVVRLPPERAVAALEDAASIAALALWMRNYR
jgi:ADP-ribose pyrophosphatase